MPLIIPKTLPAYDALYEENVFVMHRERALSQHIRPLEILILNLMPTKIATETQIARLLANTPIWENFKGRAQELNLPSAPKQFLHYFTEPDRPQIHTERMLENGMAVSIGRLREDTQYQYKFVCLSHNTLRGAAGGAVLLAELLAAEGYMD